MEVSMSRTLPLALIALCAALGVVLAVQRSTLNAARQELDQVQARVERLEAKQKEAVARKAVEELQEQVARVERKAAAASVAAEAAAARPVPKDANAPVPFTEEDITKIVEARLEEKLQAKGVGKKNDGDRKMPLFELAKELTLEAAAQAKVASIANTAKKEIFDILKTPRPDGTNAADDVIKAFTGGNQEEAQKVFMKLFTEKIPGTDTPYVTAVARVQEKANQGLAAAMGSETFDRFQHMSIKPENIETGFDPWTDYIQQKGK
jgi:hypothetical protein